MQMSIAVNFSAMLNCPWKAKKKTEEKKTCNGSAIAADSSVDQYKCVNADRFSGSCITDYWAGRRLL